MLLLPMKKLPYDAVLIVSFGGPEGPDDVVPFLENVLRGKNVPRERMLEVVKHYQNFGGVSPINQQCRDLIAALRNEFQEHGLELPIYWGNRNWAPMLDTTLQQMADDGIQRAITYFTNTFSSYSGCQQYHENLNDAAKVVGPLSPRIDKLRLAYNHPAFIGTTIELLQSKLAEVPADRRADTTVLFTAHSIPLSMAENCDYEQQLKESCRLVAEQAGHTRWELVYQSRSGPPHQPWLEPDICDRIETLHSEQNLADVVIVPIGFVSDHMEVLFDLDTEARETCDKLGINFHRAPTIGTHPRTVRMLRELVEERITIEQGQSVERPVVGQYGPSPDHCSEVCCQTESSSPAPSDHS